MSEENVEIVRSIYARWERGDMSAGIEAFDAEIDFRSFMPDSNETFVARGPEGIGNFMRDFLESWAGYRLIADEIREVGPDSVLAVGRQTATGKHSGALVESATCSAWTFHGGKVVNLSFDMDPDKALEAAGLSE